MFRSKGIIEGRLAKELINPWKDETLHPIPTSTKIRINKTSLEKFELLMGDDKLDEDEE